MTLPYNKMLPNDILDIITRTAYGQDFEPTWREITFAYHVQENFPPVFLRASCTYKNPDVYGWVNNPLRRGNAYFPLTQLMGITYCTHVMNSFYSDLDREKVRMLKTYKKIFLRRLDEFKDGLAKDSFCGWNRLFELWSKVQLKHFTWRGKCRPLVIAALVELAEAGPLPPLPVLPQHVPTFSPWPVLP